MRYNPFETPFSDDTTDYSVPPTGRFATYAAIHKSFSQTPHGLALARDVRYERYKDRQTGNEQWIDILGQDVNNLGHMWETLSLTAHFIDASEALAPATYNAEDRDLLLTAAVTHDWAEAVVGDISYSQKTDADESEEKEAFRDTVFPSYSGPSAGTIERAYQEIVFNRDYSDLLAGTFNTVERIGYMQTALRALNYAARSRATILNNGMYWLTADVMKNQIPSLVSYASRFAATKQYLQTNMRPIERALDVAADRGFHPQDDQKSCAAAYAEAQLAWRAFVRQA